MKQALILCALSLLACNAFAITSPSQFCAPQAGAAAQALANTNGTISEVVIDSRSSDGLIFDVTLADSGNTQDRYVVETDGGHDCIVRVVRVVGEPHRRM